MRAASVPGSALPAVALLRALGVGAGLVAVAVGGVVVLGLLAGDRAVYATAGAGTAVGTAGLAILLYQLLLGPRAVASFRGDPRLAATRLQGLLLTTFLLKLMVVVAAVLAMRAADVKFELSTVFAVAFAVASLLCQVAAAGMLSRSLSRSSGRSSPALAPAVAAPASPLSAPSSESS